MSDSVDTDDEGPESRDHTNDFRWYKHITDKDEQERFKRNVLGSKIVLTRLNTLLNEMEEDLNRSELSAKNYDSPNWAPNRPTSMDRKLK